MEGYKWVARVWWCFCFFLFQTGAWAHELKPSLEVKVSWGAAPNQNQVDVWSFQDIQKIRKTVSQEKEPKSGKVLKWKGFLFSQLIDRALETLSVENSAHIDLVILRSRKGESALVPRAIITKYPFLLALQQGTESHEEAEGSASLGFQSVVPWTSKPKILNEGLPLDQFFISDITQIELTNYRDRLSTYFLKRRTDPLALRGEKLFVQNCICCHALSDKSKSFNLFSLANGVDEMKKFSQNGHSMESVSLKFSDRDRRSIVRYFEAHQFENPVAVSSTAPVGHRQ